VKSLWSIRILRPWLFRRWEKRRREALEAQGRAGSALDVGDRAPRFALPDDTGRLRRSEEWFGREVVVWFTNLCDLCADQARELEASSPRGELRRAVVAVHLPGAGPRSPAAFRRETGGRIPVLVDDGSVTRTWTGEAVPDT
jgi:peroxiredoxin